MTAKRLIKLNICFNNLSHFNQNDNSNSSIWDRVFNYLFKKPMEIEWLYDRFSLKKLKKLKKLKELKKRSLLSTAVSLAAVTSWPGAQVKLCFSMVVLNKNSNDGSPFPRWETHFRQKPLARSTMSRQFVIGPC